MIRTISIPSLSFRLTQFLFLSNTVFLANAVLLANTVFLANTGLAQMIVGHRGASFDAPENTLSAFREAWRQGADGIEGDFYFTRDGAIVCIHDKDTLRTGGKRIPVAESTLAELRELDFGKWKNDQFTGEPLPTFSEVLQCVPPGKTFVIELKTGPDIVPLLAKQLEQHDADLSKLLIISFNQDTISKAKQRLPSVRAHWLTGYKQDKLTGSWHPTAEEVAKTLKQCSADGLGTQANRTIVTPAFIQTLTEQGMGEFHVWTVDEPADAKYFQQLGAIGITTNRPAFLRNALSSQRP